MSFTERFKCEDEFILCRGLEFYFTLNINISEVEDESEMEALLESFLSQKGVTICSDPVLNITSTPLTKAGKNGNYYTTAFCSGTRTKYSLPIISSESYSDIMSKALFNLIIRCPSMLENARCKCNNISHVKASMEVPAPYRSDFTKISIKIYSECLRDLITHKRPEIRERDFGENGFQNIIGIKEEKINIDDSLKRLFFKSGVIIDSTRLSFLRDEEDGKAIFDGKLYHINCEIQSPEGEFYVSITSDKEEAAESILNLLLRSSNIKKLKCKDAVSCNNLVHIVYSGKMIRGSIGVSFRGRCLHHGEQVNKRVKKYRALMKNN